MNNINYIEADDLLFSGDNNNNVYSGGFNVKSIMMKAGMSPIMTINNEMVGGGSTNKVSDLFDSLVIPSWALSYNNRIVGQDRIGQDRIGQDRIGQDRIGGNKNKKNYDSDDENAEDIDDDLHDKLLNLVREHDSKIAKMNERKAAKRTRKNRKTNKTNKGGTKKVK